MPAFAARRHARLVLCALALTAIAAIPAASAQSVGVRISIRISAPSPEALRAWRRANGLDPPDPAADAKWREQQAALLTGADAARERRRLRTVELVPIGGIEAGLANGTCTALPTATDPCTRVVSYDPRGHVVSTTGR